MTATTVRNGVNVDQLVATVQAVQQDPELAKFTFKAHGEWNGGARSKITIDEYVQAGARQERGTSYRTSGDEPSVLLGTNTAANAVETVLGALASCYAVGFSYNAAARGIQIDALSFELSGALDLHGFLGLSDHVRAGFSEIICDVMLKSSANRDELAELAAYVQRTSPVLDILRNSVPVTTRLHVEE